MTIPDTGAGTRAVEAVAEAAGAAPASDVGGTDDAFVLAQQAACEQLAVLVGRAAACRATSMPRSSWYRHNRITPPPPRPAPKPHVERVQPRALSPAERTTVRELLNGETHVDEAPATV